MLGTSHANKAGTSAPPSTFGPSPTQPSAQARESSTEKGKFIQIQRRRRRRRRPGPAPFLTGGPMAGSEELGLREDTLRVLAAFLRRGEAPGSPIPTPSRSPTQEEPTDFLSRLRRCLPCSLGRGAVPPESPRPCSLPLRPCYGSEPGPATPDFYALVAQRLEQLVQEQLKSPPSPGEVPRGPKEG
nr:bcl-2-like protein 12 [Camelus dromedarius]